MAHIGNIIKDWLDSWHHCKRCDYMYIKECNCKKEKGAENAR